MRIMNRRPRPRRLITAWVAVLIILSIALPAILVNQFILIVAPPEDIYELPIAENPQEPTIVVPVYLSQEQKVEDVPLEHYVRGVVAAEMPVEFGLEALKAQAIAARTYIIRKIAAQDFSNVPVPDAWVTDTIQHQVYLTEEQLKGRWSGREYAANISKINRAVAETKGIIITYDDEPIDATFFSTSNGYTENSEDYWSQEVPYLRSVSSPWDAAISPKYKNTLTLTYQEFLQKLGLKNVTVSSGKLSMAVVETTAGNRIKQINIGGTEFTGREVREKLGLSSSQFTWSVNGNFIEFTSYGSGHGVGMSQWGANGMAMEGKSAEEIILYYYQGVELSTIASLQNPNLKGRPVVTDQIVKTDNPTNSKKSIISRL